MKITKINKCIFKKNWILSPTIFGLKALGLGEHNFKVVDKITKRAQNYYGNIGRKDKENIILYKI